jgi:hypothetical protein
MKPDCIQVALPLILGFFVNGLCADPLEHWTWRFPNPQGLTLNAVTYGGGQFVAVGDNGTIINSSDGFNWTVQTYDVFPTLNGIAYAGGVYAAVGDGGVIVVSSNAVTWTTTPSATTNSLRAIAGGGYPQFLAVGDSGTSIVGTGGANWTAVASDTTDAFYGVSLDSNLGLYIVVGGGGTVLGFDTKPESWLVSTAPSTENNLNAIACADTGVVVAVGDLNQSISPVSGINQILYSEDDGMDWTNQLWTDSYYNPAFWYPSGDFILRAVTYGPNGFVAVGDTGYSLEYDHPGVMLTSTNGDNWAEMPEPTCENRLYGATYGKGLYVVVGDAGGIDVSSNLVNWIEVSGYHRSAITAIACSTNLCIASGFPMTHLYVNFPDFTTIVSTNGLNWSVSSTNLPPFADLTSGGNEFVGVSYNSLYSTTDGYNWRSNSTSTNAFHGVCYANNQFIAVGDNGSIFASLDGITWTNLSIPTTGSFYGVAYGNRLYAIAGTVAATSTDGVAWSLCSSNPPALVTRIVYGAGRFVATAYVGSSQYPSGQILTSQDGANWKVQCNAPSGFFSGLAYSGGTFLTAEVAYTSTGSIFKSSDGTNWDEIAFNLPTVDQDEFLIYYSNLGYLVPSIDGSYATVCAYQGSFLAAGLDGILVQSGNTWNASAIYSPQLTSNGLNFAFNEQIDVPFHIQTSTNLLDWVNIYNGVGSGAPINFDTATSGTSAEFFRIASP